MRRGGRGTYSVLIHIELRAGFCDPDGELLAVLDRPGWQLVVYHCERIDEDRDNPEPVAP